MCNHMVETLPDPSLGAGSAPARSEGSATPSAQGAAPQLLRPCAEESQNVGEIRIQRDRAQRNPIRGLGDKVASMAALSAVHDARPLNSTRIASRNLRGILSFSDTRAINTGPLSYSRVSRYRAVRAYLHFFEIVFNVVRLGQSSVATNRARSSNYCTHQGRCQMHAYTR